MSITSLKSLSVTFRTPCILKSYLIKMSSANTRPDVYVGSHYFPNLAEKVKSSLPDVKVIPFRTKDKSTINENDVPAIKQNAEVIFCDSTLLKDLHEYKKLKWLQLKGAGVDPVLKKLNAEEKPQFRITRVNANGGLVGEYVISFILAIERRVFMLHENQKQKSWARTLLHQSQPRLISKLTICILGVGQLGKEVAKRCKEFEMTVHGVTRSECEQGQRSEFVDKYSTIKQLGEVIATCDYICCCLPSTPETHGLLSGDVLKICMDKKPVLISCGRGDVINEATIIKAIQEEWIGGAVLDVVEQEPLPETSPLWKLPNVYITPHIAGYSTDDTNVQNYVDVFVENYRRYCEGKELLNEIDLERGY